MIMNQRRIRRSAAKWVGRALVAGSLLPWAGRAAGPTLPLPCVAGSCGANASTFVGTGAATAVASGNTLAVSQTSNAATLNWASFNIGAGNKVVFTQPSSTAVALNRIFDANPSAIFGSLTANGQIYLLNANGFLFGPGANVNVAGLIASSLNITDQTFASGILAPINNNNPALQAYTVTDAAGHVSDVVNTGTITVQPGAALTASTGGRLFLAAPTISNGGTLSSPNGQVILAAGQRIYIAPSPNSDLRGLLVEVDDSSSAAKGLMGMIANQQGGQISATHGNVTLAGLMVNQDGRISATTSVSENGSVTLSGGDGYLSGSLIFTPTQGGTVELGANSSISILPDLSDPTTAVTAQQQLPSEVNITAQQVFMHGATIDAPSGKLTVLAATDPVSPNTVSAAGANPEARIRIDAGTTIDLSGSQAALPATANLVTLQLRSNEFADDPTQRNGALRGATVTIDVRADGGLGTPIADTQAAIAAVGSTVAQRTETGGSVSFQSEGDIVFNPGATINVSGGATTYQAGTIQTTSLVGANGQLYDIGSANPLLTYKGVVNPTFTQSFNQWGVTQVVPTPGLSHYESSYVQGASAGSVTFVAPSQVLDGTLQAHVVSGPYQRGPLGSAFGDAPLGGTLTIGVASGQIAGQTALQPTYDFFSPSMVVTGSPTPVVVADTAALPIQALQLPVADLTAAGFTTLQLYSNTSVTLPAGLPLQLTPGASLTVQAPRIDLDSSITAPAGTLSFTNLPTVASLAIGGPRPGIGIGDGVTLDVGGQWTNDATPTGGVGTAPTLQNAGALSLQLTTPGAELVLGNDVALKADGGAWLQASGTASYGTGGSISLDASPAQAALQFGAGTSVEAFGTGTAKGGSFSLAAPRIEVSQGNGSAWTQAQRLDDLTGMGQVLQLYAPLFADFGFSNVNLTATGTSESNVSSDVLTVAAGTTINAETVSRQLQPGYQNVATGGPIGNFLQVATLPGYLRPVTSVSLVTQREIDDLALGPGNFGTIDIQAGASILSDPGSTISLLSEGSIAVAGTLRAPGGTITLQTLSPADVSSKTSDSFDAGFIPTQGIELADTATLDVKGTTVMTPNSGGLLLGTVLPGGTVNLLADRGTVVTEAGSSIDISGTSAMLDLQNTRSGTYAPTSVASPGGSVIVSSNESISLLGDLSAAAGTGDVGQAAAGSLAVDLVRGVPYAPSVSQLPDTALEIELVDSTATTTPSGPYSNLAILGVAQLQRSGIDALSLQVSGGAAPGTVLLDASSSLTMGRLLSLDAPNIAVPIGLSASLSAPVVQIGNSQSTNSVEALPSAPVAGTGTLSVSAQQVTLLGNVGLQGVTNATITSQGDVQLAGTINPNSNGLGNLTGSLTSSGNVTINAARIYPDTYTSFSLQSPAGIGSTVAIGQTSASPGTPLSAGGSLSIAADNIAISGTVLAPFGQINLIAGDSLLIAKGSLVSVSGAGLAVPFGETQLNAAQWIYAPGSGSGGGGTVVNTILGVPTKTASLTAPEITLESGATVNLSGGGDLYAYEFVPGTGGSKDALKTGVIPGLYAILPAAAGQAAPYDPQESASPTQTQTVYLSGGAGVAAGVYALLPARYALQPGADLVQIEPTYVSTSGGQIGTLADGTPVIGGYMSFANTGLHTGLTEYQGFAVYPGSYARQLANYTISNASSYFGAQAVAAGTGPVSEPADAGMLTLAVSQSTSPTVTNKLDLAGSVLTAATSGGRGALINISAPDLTITSGTDTSGASGITVSAPVIQSWNASQLTLGGTTSTSTVTPLSSAGLPESLVATTSIAVAADTVKIDSGVSLTADQIDVVAQTSIDVQGGASLASTSGTKGTALKSLPAQQIVTLTDSTGANPLPQGALLAVSDLNLPVVGQATTNGVPVLGRPALNGATGATITLESGSSVASGGAIALDTPGGITVAGTTSGKGASWSLSSSTISFGAASGSPNADSLNIDSPLLASLQQAGAVRLASSGAIDIDSPVALGATAVNTTPTLSSLTLIGTSLNNNAGAGASGSVDSVFGAGTMTLGGAGATSTDPYMAGNGTLSLFANSLVIGPGTLAVNGFAHTQAQVAGAVQTQGAGGLNVGGTLAINAVELTAAPDATDSLGTTLLSTGSMSIGAPTKLASGTTLPPLIGGNLTLSAPSVEDAGAIIVPSGLVTLNATGGDLHLASTASIDAAGRIVPVVNQTEGTPGGGITLAATGNVILDAGSKIGVAGAGTAPAGAIGITGSTVDVSGTLSGAAGSATGTGGSLTLNAGQSVNGLTALAANLSNGGFTNAVDIRVASGNLDLASSGTLTADSITLTADSGSVDIGGVLSAPSAATRGRINLSGGIGVTLDSGAALHADGTGAAGRGGEIDINSTCLTCSITLASGSTISAAGSAQMGELVLRAPVYGTSGNDVAINVGPGAPAGIGADVSAAGQVIVEPLQIYQESAATIAKNLTKDVNAAAGFLGTATPVIAARLTTPSATPISVQVGVEIQDANPGDALKLSSLDLSKYSSQGQVVDLTVRGAGSITIAGTISDGIMPQTVTTTGATGVSITGTGPAVYPCSAGGPCASGSLSFIAGADLSSANPFATLAGSAASLTLGLPPKGAVVNPGMVRTGTGDVTLAAAGNLVFNQGSSAYTAGTGTAAAAGAILGGSSTSAPGVVNFASGGGNVSLTAGGDVMGSPVAGYAKNNNYSVTGWQIREGNGTTAAQYGNNLAAFDWNVGALAGGDVTVAALGQASGSAGQVMNLSAATADSYVSDAASGHLIGAGGGVSVAARSDIGSAQIYVADGVGTLSAGGGLTAVQTTSQNVPVGSSFALGDSQISVWARQGVQVNAIYNPTYTAQTNSLAQGNGAYLSYGANSAVSLASTDGSVLLDISQNLDTLLGPNIYSAKNGFGNYFILPSSLSIASYQQDIAFSFANYPVLFPSITGQLQLFAGRDIAGGGGTLTMADSLPDEVPTPATPGISLPQSGALRNGFEEFQGALHAGDASPALITAGRDIVDLGLSIPKAADVVAGRDLLSLTYGGQNLSASDTTLISAGRDATDQLAGGISVGGPGSVDLLIGRNLDFGFGNGIQTVGNFANVNLPSAVGADVTLLVGYGTQGADNASFLTNIVSKSPAYMNELVTYVASLTGQSNLDYPHAATVFSSLTETQQAGFIDNIFFNELLLSGRAANAGTGVGFSEGYAAIDALFPNSRTVTATQPDPYLGNLSLSESQIYTLSGGNISIVVPGGGVNVGLAVPPATLASKPASQLGIVVEETGNIDIYSKGDVNVNQSRVFTLGGGNILIWSNEGSIDAGNGAKSSLSVPPPVVQIDSMGNITLNFGASLAGSGIRTIQTDPSTPAGNVDLDAPVGTVNAGDAGIGAAGNVNIAAAHVIGVSNINFGGTATGVPSDISSLGASLSGVSSVASGSTSSSTQSVAESNATAKEAAPLAQTALSWLDVFVTGLGEENCKPDDIECLKRQKTASP